tara:strand:+ start:1288 stop:1578 length:291 start_codon:yes stop_codon:yes gene_type:complete
MKLIDAINESDRIVFDSYHSPLEVTANEPFITKVIMPKISKKLLAEHDRKSSSAEQYVWKINDKIFATFNHAKGYSHHNKKMFIKYYVYKEEYQIF